MENVKLCKISFWKHQTGHVYIAISKNRGTPKSSIQMRFSMKSTIHLGVTPWLWKPSHDEMGGGLKMVDRQVTMTQETSVEYV